MSKYVNRVKLEFDGVIFDDFSQFSDDSVEKHVRVDLMNKTGHAEKTERYGFSVTVLTPQVQGVDIRNVADGTCTVEYDSGQRVTYQGVYCLETGDNPVDGETPANRTMTFSAERKVEE